MESMAKWEHHESAFVKESYCDCEIEGDVMCACSFNHKQFWEEWAFGEGDCT